MRQNSTAYTVVARQPDPYTYSAYVDEQVITDTHVYTHITVPEKKNHFD